MKLFPEAAATQLEFDKIKKLLFDHCQNEWAKHQASNLRIHTKKEFILPELSKTQEFQSILMQQFSFPDYGMLHLQKELKLLSIDGSTLSGEQFLQLRKLAIAIQDIIRWFNSDRKQAYPYLFEIVSKIIFERTIVSSIDEVLDELGIVKDSASENLARIRNQLFKKRNELKRTFDKTVSRLKKLGYLADIEESFLNGRRVLAVFAEQKRMVKGIMHGESESRRTTFIEPEEVIHLNNEVYGLEMEERKEVNLILLRLTKTLRKFDETLNGYYHVIGLYDFVRAKAKLSIEYNGKMPQINDRPTLKLIRACHPLLYLYNKKLNKPVVPLNIQLNEKERILIISGPNAGGKTVTLKTIGLLQLMVQSGLLVSCDDDSEFGIFKQIMIHIGDTQNLEFELSTYSSHLMHMKHFMENANGRTLFFIDELGSGSDPNLGGAFAEVILEELTRRGSFGVVTTHYLNLKVMANETKGIINGAMAFDEKKLMPLYQLIVGKPGSSYTFSIAERIGLPQHLINRAKKLVDENHFKLDQLLNNTEQHSQDLAKNKLALENLLKKNEQLKNEMERVIKKETHLQQIELLKQQNKMSEEKLAQLKDTERKIKSLISEWKKSEDKANVIKTMQAVLYKQAEKSTPKRRKKNAEKLFVETGEEVSVDCKVLLINNGQTGMVTELRGKKAVVQVGHLPIVINITDLAVIKDLEKPE